MHDKHLVESLPYVLGIVAAGTGVTLKTDLNASTASTNGKVIHFPPLPYKGEELAIYALGYLIHEAGHIRSSDFGTLSDAAKTPLLRMLINILEDVRIERLINLTYPGARFWLDGLTLKFVQTKRQGVVDPNAELALVMIRYLQDWLFESVLNYKSVRGIGVQQRDVWRSKVSIELADQVEKLALSAAWASNTTQVITASIQIIDLLQKEHQSAEQQSQQQQSNQPSQSDAGAGAGADDDSSDSTDGQVATEAGLQEGDPSPEGESQSDSSGQSSTPSEANPNGGDPDQNQSCSSSSIPLQQNCDPSQAGQGSSASQSDPGQTLHNIDQKQVNPQAYSDALNAVLCTDELEQGADRGDAIKQDMQSSVGTSRARYDSTFTLPEVMPLIKKGGDSAAIDRVKTASIALRYRMAELLEAKMKSRRSLAEGGKRLVRDAGRRLALGDFRVYEKRVQGQKIDTAVHVLLDISGSMSFNGRCQVALDASLALGVALQDLDGINFSMSAFPFHQHSVVDIVLPGELVRDVAARASLMVPNGTTPLDMGLLHAHTSLMTTKASRRVCLVVTDGEPDDYVAVKLLIEMGQGDGIEYLGIGIECPTYHIFPNSCTVNNLEDLPKQVIAMMQNFILLPLAA